MQGRGESILTPIKIIMKNIFLVTVLFLISNCNHEIQPGQMAAGPKPSDENAVVTGTVELPDGVTPKGFGTLFVIARSSGEIAGPPLAVRRFEGPIFPVSFQLSQKNVIMSDSPFVGVVTITAKWSKQGSPMSASSGDLSTSLGRDVAVGTRDVKIVLDKVED